MKLVNVLSSLTLCSLLFVGCVGEKNEVKATDDTKLVSVKAANMAVNSRTISYTATIEPMKKNNISSAAQMRIDEVFVEVGDNVRKGQILAELDKSQLIQQEIQLENLATDLLRTKELYEAGGVSKQQLDQQETSYNVAKKALQYLKDNATLTSPINGIVTARYYDAGDMFSLTPGTSGAAAIYTVMQIDAVKVRVNISERYLPVIKNGMEIDITTESYPNEVFKGKVSLIFPLVDAATHTFTVEVSIPNKELKLRPGMFATASVILSEDEMLITEGAAVQKQSGSNEKYVFVVENGIAKRTTVTLGNTYGMDIEIVSGLNKGDLVVTQGAGRLSSGDKVKTSK